MSTEYLRKPHKEDLLRDRVAKVLERGPLNTIQIAIRLGTKASHVSALCVRYPDIFEKASTHKPTTCNPMIWKLKEK